MLGSREELLKGFIGHEYNADTWHNLVVLWQDASVQSTQSLSAHYVPKSTKKAHVIDTSPTTCPLQLHPSSDQVQGKCSCSLQISTGH
jgi:hypothetical protein